MEPFVWLTLEIITRGQSRQLKRPGSSRHGPNETLASALGAARPPRGSSAEAKVAFADELLNVETEWAADSGHAPRQRLDFGTVCLADS